MSRVAAGLFCVGFGGVEPSQGVRSLIRLGVAGVVLFARNLESREQATGLIAALREEASPRPLLIAVDHEGGRVQRLTADHGVTRLPSARDVAASEDPEAAAAACGALAAGELRALGVDLNFAPVLDVDSNPLNPVIGDRSFGRDPSLVARLAVAFIQAHQAGGVAACGKHFPGHGDTDRDSHFHLPTLPHDLARLERVELPPFVAAIRAGVAAVMTAHVMFPALDPDRPATMSRAILLGLLRERLGFGGVIVSDDLEMRAVADGWGVERAAVEAVGAGADLLLVCEHTDVAGAAIDAVTRAAERGEVERGRVVEANRRVGRLADEYVPG